MSQPGDPTERPGGFPRDPAAELPSLPVRVGQVFFAPGALFDRLKDRPAWFGALALGAVLAVVAVVAIPPEIWSEMVRAQLLESGQPVPEQLTIQGNLFRIGGAVATGIVWFVMAFVSAGIATFVFAFVLGDEVSYRQVLSGLSHAFLVTAVGGLLVLPLRIARRDPQLTLSVGTFLPGVDGYVGALLGGLDLFSLWAYALAGIAISRFDRRRSAGAATTVFLAFFLGLVALFAIFQA